MSGESPPCVYASALDAWSGSTQIMKPINIPKESWSAGMATTYVDRPFLDREALVNTLDYTFKRGKIFARGRFIRSDISKKDEFEKLEIANIVLMFLFVTGNPNSCQYYKV